MNIVAERMKTLRASVRISQKELGAIIGITQSAVNRYENKQAEASYGVLLRYADFFDVSLDYIYGRTDQPQGKLYAYRPKIEETAEMQAFIEMCFDPKSPMSGKLKDMLLHMMTGGETE